MPDNLSSKQEETTTSETTTTTAGDTTTATDPGVSTAVSDSDITTLFTPEELTAKKESVAATKAEETRRAALTDEARAAEDATKATEAKANEVPETYEFTMPDGVELDKETLDKVTPLFKELKLPQAQAAKFIDAYIKDVLPAFVKRQADTWKATTDGWAEAAKKDPEIGGTKFAKSVEDAQRAVNTLNPALKPLFDQYGLGNHPEMIRAFAKVADLLGEDTISNTKKNEQTGKSIAERMFPGLPLK